MSKPTRSLEFCRRALEQREDFWAKQAEAIHWQKPFDQVCDFSKPPFARWFVSGKTNLCYNAIDRHLASRANQPALHYISTKIDAEQSFTYRELYDEVCRFAAVLQSLGLVVQNLGAFARPAAIYVVRALPKTRSGKILRRAVHAAIEGRDTGDLSTLEDPIALEAIKELLEVTKKSR